MNFFDIINRLEDVIPVLASLTGHPELGVLAQKLIDIGEEEITRRTVAQNRTRTEILQDAAIAYADAQVANATLKGLGHEVPEPEPES